MTDPKNDDELIRPARDGTLRVLKAARDAGVKRVVMTSSISAIIYGRGAREKPFTEADWTDETNRRDTSPYDRAKTIAERAAWAWLAAEGGGLELVAVNPSLVLGPVLGADFSASIEVDQEASRRLDPRAAALRLQRGRRARHRAAARLGDDDAAGGGGPVYWLRRFLLDVRCREECSREGLGDKAKKVPSIPVPDFVARMAALFDPIVRGRLYELGKKRPVSSEKARRMLGWTPRPVEETVLDAARSLQAGGLA